jgi:hypothetical protein
MRANPPLPNLVESSSDSPCKQLTIAEQARLCVIAIEQSTEAEIRSESHHELERVATLIVRRLIAMVTATTNRPIADAWQIKTFPEYMQYRLLKALHGRHEVKASLIGALAVVLTSRLFISVTLRFEQLDCPPGGSFSGYLIADPIAVPDHLQAMVRESANPQLQAVWRLAEQLMVGKSLDELTGSGSQSTGRVVNPPRKIRLLTHAGRTQSLSRWASDFGLSASSLSNRLDRLGWDVERALTEPSRRARAPKADSSKLTPHRIQQ